MGVTLITPRPLTPLQEAVNAGYTVEPEGFTLGLQESDRNAFTQLLTLVRLAEEMNVATESYQIRDKSGQNQTLTRERLKQVLLAYGAYYAGLYFSA